MFLSVPILVVLLIILNNFKETKKIALLLSETGELKINIYLELKSIERINPKPTKYVSIDEPP